MSNPDLAWKTWTYLEATEWKFLPCAGGLLDQPEALWGDVMIIAAMDHSLKEETNVTG